MKRRVFVSSLAVLATLGVLLAVTFGQPDAGEHPYVGAILFRVGTAWYSCSGTLISSTAVLTAGHCVETADKLNYETWVNFTETITLPGAGGLAAYLSNPANGWIKASTVVPHPQYSDYAQFPRTYDIGVVILPQPVTGINTFGVLPTEDFLRTVTNKRGDNQFTVVGYGMQGYIRPFYSDVFSRYKGKVRLIELNSTFNGGQSAKFTSNPGQGGGSCFGDSGGPIFYGNTNMVVALVSWGITPCIGVSYEFRTDTEVALEFLAPYR